MIYEFDYENRKKMSKYMTETFFFQCLLGIVIGGILGACIGKLIIDYEESYQVEKNGLTSLLDDSNFISYCLATRDNSCYTYQDGMSKRRMKLVGLFKKHL